MERELEGEKVLRWLAKAQPEPDILHGCSIYDDSTDAEFLIERVDFQRRIVDCIDQGARRLIAFNALIKFYVIDRSDGLTVSALVDRHSAETSTFSERLFNELKNFGGPKLIQNELDAEVILKAIDSAKTGVLLPRDLRHSVFELSKKHMLWRFGQRIGQVWSRLVKGEGPPFPADVYVHLSFFARANREIDYALRTTNFIFLPPAMKDCTPRQHAIITTIRAAILMDMHVESGELELLEQARKTLGMAWASDQSEHVRSAYRRLQAYEENRDRIASKRFWKEQLSRIGDPNDISAHGHSYE